MDQDKRNNYTYISTATTTQVKEGACVLRKVIVGTTAAGSIQVIDDITGTTAVIAELQASILPGVYEFNIQMSKGIRVITAGASKVTVVWTT